MPRRTPRAALHAARGTVRRHVPTARGVMSRPARQGERAATIIWLSARAAHLSSAHRCAYCARDSRSLARLPARADHYARIPGAAAARKQVTWPRSGTMSGLIVMDGAGSPESRGGIEIPRYCSVYLGDGRVYCHLSGVCMGSVCRERQKRAAK